MNNQQLRSLERVLAYLKRDEKKHYEESSAEERENHIYNDILILEEYLKQHQKGEINS